MVLCINVHCKTKCNNYTWCFVNIQNFTRTFHKFQNLSKFSSTSTKTSHNFHVFKNSASISTSISTKHKY